MTENIPDLTNLASEPVEADFADIFDDWIGGATIAQRSVQIYGDPALYAEYEKLNRQLAIEKQVAEAEPSLGDKKVSKLEEQITDLANRWDASMSMWTVRGLTSEEQTKATEPMDEPPAEPDEPERPILPRNANEQARKNHTLAMKAYEAEKTTYDGEFAIYAPKIKAFNRELNLHLVSAAVLKIEWPDGRVKAAELTDDYEMVTPAVTVEQLARLRKRLGDLQIVRLLQASQLATLEEPELTAPFSQSSSQDDQTL